MIEIKIRLTQEGMAHSVQPSICISDDSPTEFEIGSLLDEKILSETIRVATIAADEKYHKRL